MQINNIVMRGHTTGKVCHGLFISNEALVLNPLYIHKCRVFNPLASILCNMMATSQRSNWTHSMFLCVCVCLCV